MDCVRYYMLIRTGQSYALIIQYWSRKITLLGPHRSILAVYSGIMCGSKAIRYMVHAGCCP